jgi:hypothetical protein
MSPSPELSPQSSKLSSADQASLTTKAALPEPESEHAHVSESPKEESVTKSLGEESPVDSSQPTPLLRKPPVRPIAKPQPPSAPVEPKAPVHAATAAVKPAAPAVSPSVSTTSTSPAEVAQITADAAQFALRQQPIPPPSEPKQYRAIGLVRGSYTPSEEEFTRGEMLTTDGTVLKSVLLGRVMSLVKNHVDLTKEHLWVVYPRIRELEARELNLQIVGIWEPETLKRSEDSEENSESGEKPVEFVDSDSLDDGYFSIRGEIVFFSEEEKHIVVKIQQAPRKNTQKAKAFKISLKGGLDNPKTVGYFWDFNVRLQNDDLVMEAATCVGMAPPRKKSPEELAAGKSRSRRPPMGGRRPPAGGGGAGRSPAPRPGAPRAGGSRESTPKPVKRNTEQSSEG